MRLLLRYVGGKSNKNELEYKNNIENNYICM